MEAATVQPVAKDVGHKPNVQKNGSGQAPREDFGSMVEGIINAERKQKTVSSKDVTPSLEKSADKGLDTKGDEASNETPVASAPGKVKAEGRAPAEVDKSEEQIVSVESPPKAVVGDLLKALAQLAAEGVPAPDPSRAPAQGAEEAPSAGGAGDPAALVEQAALNPTEHEEAKTQGSAVQGALALEAATTAGSEKSSKEIAQELIASLEEGALNSGETEADESVRALSEGAPGAERAKNAVKDAPGDKAPSKLFSKLFQAEGDKQGQAKEASFLIGGEASEESTQTAPLPSSPKEAVKVEVEALKLAPSKDAQEAEVEPVKPMGAPSSAQADDPSAGSLDVARSLSQAQSADYSRDVAAPARTAAPPSVERVVEKLVQVVQAGGPQERHEVTIQLDPPALGKVHLKVLVEDTKIHVALFTTTNEAKDLVDSHSSQLRSALHQHGLALEQFSVEVRSGLANNMGQHDLSSWLESFGWAPPSRPGDAAPFEMGASAESWNYFRTDAPYRVDLFV